MLLSVVSHCFIFAASLLPIVFSAAPSDSNPRHGPVSDHGKLCSAVWGPNLDDATHALNSCNTTSQCGVAGFECIAGSGLCCPTKALVCSLPNDSGHETLGSSVPNKHYRRYAYEPELNACLVFSYFGSGGNYNNFLRHRDCVSFCQRRLANDNETDTR